MAMGNIKICFEMGDRDWTRQFLLEARDVNRALYSSQESVERLRILFPLITDDLSARATSVNTIKDYCYELLNYCVMSNDWRDWARWAESINQQIEPGDKIWLLYGWGRYLEEFGQYAQSIVKHQEGLVLCQTLGDAPAAVHWQAAHYDGMGIALQRMNRFEEAESYLKQAIALFESERHDQLQSNALANLASCYDRQDKHAEAIASYEESIRLLQKIDNRFDLGRVLYSIGIAYTMAHQFDSARSAFREGRQACRETGNGHSLILSYHGVAILQYRLGQYAEAKSELEEAFELFRRENASGLSGASFPEVQGNLYLLAGAIHIRLHEPDVALKYLEQAELLYKQIDSSEELLAKVIANRARVYESLKDYSEAETLFMQLAEMGRQLHAPMACRDAGVHLFYIYLKRRASLFEWTKLIWRLGPTALYGTALGILERVRQINGVRMMKATSKSL